MMLYYNLSTCPVLRVTRDILTSSTIQKESFGSLHLYKMAISVKISPTSWHRVSRSYQGARMTQEIPYTFLSQNY